MALLIVVAIVLAILWPDDSQSIEWSQNHDGWPARGSLTDDDDVITSALAAWDDDGAETSEGEPSEPGSFAILLLATEIPGDDLPFIYGDDRDATYQFVVAASGGWLLEAHRPSGDERWELSAQRVGTLSNLSPLHVAAGVLLPTAFDEEVEILSGESPEYDVALGPDLDEQTATAEDGLLLGEVRYSLIRVEWANSEGDPEIFAFGWAEGPWPVDVRPDDTVDGADLWLDFASTGGASYVWAVSSIVGQQEEPPHPEGSSVHVEVLGMDTSDESPLHRLAAVAVTTRGSSTVAATLVSEQRYEVHPIGESDDTDSLPLAMTTLESDEFGDILVHAATPRLTDITLQAEGETVPLPSVGAVHPEEISLDGPLVLSASASDVAHPDYPATDSYAIAEGDVEAE